MVYGFRSTFRPILILLLILGIAGPSLVLAGDKASGVSDPYLNCFRQASKACKDHVPQYQGSENEKAIYVFAREAVKKCELADNFVTGNVNLAGVLGPGGTVFVVATKNSAQVVPGYRPNAFTKSNSLKEILNIPRTMKENLPIDPKSCAVLDPEQSKTVLYPKLMELKPCLSRLQRLNENKLAVVDIGVCKKTNIFPDIFGSEFQRGGSSSPASPANTAR